MTDLQKKIQEDQEKLNRWNEQDREWEEYNERENGHDWDGVSK